MYSNYFMEICDYIFIRLLRSFLQVTFDSFSSSAPSIRCPGSTEERRVCLVSWALALGAVASVTFRLWQLPLPLLFFPPFPSLVFLENFGFVGVVGGFGSGF